MKLRLLVMGCILAALGLILDAARGLDVSFIGLSLVGVVLLVVGLLWK